VSGTSVTRRSEFWVFRRSGIEASRVARLTRYDTLAQGQPYDYSG